MLRQRIITALVLAALLLPTLWVRSAWPFMVFTLAMISAAAWEWARLNGQPQTTALLGGAVVAGAGLWASLSDWRVGDGRALWWLAAAVWVVGGGLVLRLGPAGWHRWPAAVRWLVGLALLWIGWWAMAQARVMGVNFLLSTMCIVFAADIAAYFGGRAFGRRKLAPSISPGKSWEGVWSGWAGVLALAIFWMTLDAKVATDSPSVFTLLRQRYGAVPMALAVLALAGISVVGDLFESLVKRAAGAKDSSRLLPGHGGVLDRIDALLPVLPCALALASL
ncbi:MAG: phosphatidate cytidylyltransferase [Burkholderiaceae bacterium]